MVKVRDSTNFICVLRCGNACARFGFVKCALSRGASRNYGYVPQTHQCGNYGVIREKGETTWLRCVTIILCCTMARWISIVGWKNSAKLRGKRARKNSPCFGFSQTAFRRCHRQQNLLVDRQYANGFGDGADFIGSAFGYRVHHCRNFIPWCA